MKTINMSTLIKTTKTRTNIYSKSHKATNITCTSKSDVHRLAVRDPVLGQRTSSILIAGPEGQGNMQISLITPLLTLYG